MQDINFQITEQDIRDYLKRHRNDENIKYQEALFVKYMKETEDFGQEALQMLLSKYHMDYNNYTDVSTYGKKVGLIKKKLNSFHDYLSTIQNLDISGACHILIPAIRFYGQVTSFKTIKLGYILETLKVQSTGENQEVLLDTLENYSLANQLAYIDNSKQIMMNESRAGKELEKLEIIYGTMAIKKMEKAIKMGRY